MQRTIKLTHLATGNLNSRRLHEFLGSEEQTLTPMGDYINTVLSNIKPPCFLIATPKLTETAALQDRFSSRGHIYYRCTRVLTLQQHRNTDKSVQEVQRC